MTTTTTAAAVTVTSVTWVKEIGATLLQLGWQHIGSKLFSERFNLKHETFSGEACLGSNETYEEENMYFFC